MRPTLPRLRALLPILLVPALAAGCGSSGDSKGDSGSTAAAKAASRCTKVPAGSVASVNCANITKAEFDHLLGVGVLQLKANGQPVPKAGSAEYEQLRERVLKYLVQRTEIQLEAKKRKLAVDQTKVAADLASYQKQCCKGKPAEYQKYLKKTGLTDADIRGNLELNQLGQKLYDAVTKDASFTYPESRRVAHILIDVAPKGKVTEADRKAALDVLRQLKAGANFATLAKKYSVDPGSKDKGGEYTEKKGEFDPAFEAAAFKLETGQLTDPPIKTMYGYHIIKALGDLTKPAKKAVKDAKTPDEQQLASQAKSEAGNRWFTDIEKYYAARTVFAPGFRTEPAPSVGSTGAGASGSTAGATTGG